MIKNYTKFNEGIKHLLVGPTKEEIWTELINGELKGLLDSVPNSPEDFFFKMKEDCEKLDNGIYIKNGIILFQQNLWKRYLDISSEYIWSIIKKVYNLTYDDIQLLIKKLLINDKKWKRLTPYSHSFIYNK